MKGYKMNLKDYKEDLQVQFVLTAVVSDNYGNQRTAIITGLSFDSLIEQEHKIDHALNESIMDMFEDLPESEEL